jgi:hypothetical protein
MAGSPASQIVQWQKQQASNAASLVQLMQQQVDLNAQFTNIVGGTLIGNLKTAPLNSDGTQNNIPDASPNSSHPISADTYGLPYALTVTQYTQLQTEMNRFLSLYQGNAVTADAATSAILSFVVGG